MQKILLVSHCLLNTAAKVKRYKRSEIDDEENFRKKFIKAAVDSGIQLIQLPCPELLQMGLKRWGHTYEQFSNVFFRDQCRRMLEPVILQLKEYTEHGEEFEILGVLGVDGSPSCGVKYTCRADWGGEFSGRDVSELLKSCRLAEGNGVLMEVFRELLDENGIALKFEGLFPPEPDRAMELLKGCPADGENV